MNTSNKKISVIIPLFNTEKYIEECINSVLIQDIDFELIVIDDGSTDASYRIVKEIAKWDKRIILISQENQGVAITRNSGLETATGDYIGFLDCDDWILSGSLEKLYHEAQCNNADVVMGNTLFFYSEKNIVQRYHLPDQFFKYIFSGELLFCALMNNSSYIPMVYNYIYKRSFIENNKLRFENINHEDELWTLQAMCKAKTTSVIDLPFYFYRQRDGSIMNGGLGTNNKVESLKFISQYLYDFASNNKFGDDTKLWILVKSIQMLYYSTLYKQSNCVYSRLLHKLNNMFNNINREKAIQHRYFDYYNRLFRHPNITKKSHLLK